MTITLRFMLAMLVVAACWLESGARADDQKAKEPEKKKQPPAADIVVNDALINADLKDKIHTQSFCKTYTIKMQKGKSYQIELSNSAFPAALRLEDLGGTQVATSVNQFGGPRPVLLYEPLKTEDHQIVVTSLNAGATGKFTLVVKDASAYSVLNISDKLNQNDKQYAGAGNKRHKLFLVNLEKGKTYQIDMKSRAFDSYLFFESPDGKLLAQDDDGGGFPDARIVHKATETGKHRIIATYFGGGGNLGEFTVTVRQTGLDAPRPDMKDIRDKK